MGRLRSESLSKKKENAVSTAVTTGNTFADIEASLRKNNTPQSQIDSILKDLKKQETSTPATTPATGAKASGGSSSSASGSSSSVKVSGDSKTTKSSTTTIKGGSSSSSSTQTVTYDANGKKITIGGANGSEAYNTSDKNYSGSTISGMGAKFSIFYDRKIINKEGKSYVEIGGVQHLIDEDGWIHGLNIDATDKKINYNIAYENYFDTSCESMLTFMKNKYKDLLGDFNMNKDYVHNLQVENRRYINKISVMTKEVTEISLKLNTCEQKVQGEKVKKSTLYHNIKDIKRIKVDTRIKEMQITITKLETTINNYKIEITNLKIIITNNKKKCDETEKTFKHEHEDGCKKKILDIETKCKIDIDIQIKKYTVCEAGKIQINIDLGKCREKNKICENSECSKKLMICQNELRITLQKNVTINITIEKNNLEINKYKIEIEKYKKIEIDIRYKLKICLEGKKVCQECEGAKKKCETENITIIKKYETTIIENNLTIKACKTAELEWNVTKLALIECKSNFRDLKIKIEAQCKSEKIIITRDCEESKTILHKTIEKINIDITNITKINETCKSERAKCELDKAECNKKLEINIKIVKDECEKSIKEKDEKCQTDIKFQITLLEQCKDEKKKEIETKDKECNESKEALNKQISEITIKIEYEVKMKLEFEGQLKECTEKKKDSDSKNTQCESAKSEITTKYEIIITKKELNCSDATLIIQKKWDTCKEDINKETIKVDECRKSVITLNVEIEKKIKIINTNIKECTEKIDKKIVDIRKEEEASCKIKVDIQINHYSSCKAETLTCINQLATCNADLTIYIKLKGFDAKLIKCESDLKDRDSSITENKIDINAKIVIINKLKIDIKNITIISEKCEKDKNSDLIKVDLETCRKLLEVKISLIKQLKIFIDKSFLEFRLTISEMRLSYNVRIQKLITIISNTKSQQTQIKIIIDSHTTKIDSNNTDKENYEKQIKELHDRITVLIRQRTEYLSKLDTIDSTSITLISEIKLQIISIQRDIDENNTRIYGLQVILIQINKEINKYQGEIEVYKQNIEYYIETLEKYEEIKGSLEEYIKKLEAIIKKKTIDGTDQGTSIDISVYIKNIDTQDKDVIFKMNNQIEKFEVTLKEMTRKYNEEYKSFTILLKQCDTTCNSRISIIQQEKNEMEEKCDKKVNIRITEINKTHQITILEIRQSYRKEIIELKKKCTDLQIGGSTIDSTTYNFDIYRKHCLILIEKNTQDDCKAIGEIRSYYNEKCIMTSLPGSSKDLTTFASSDFTDDRNAKMMKRLNSSK